jgi:hypothetical protein
MASVSPDGNWLAFSRSAEVYLIPFDNPAAKPVLVGEGTAPQWSPDGRELFLRRGEQMLAAPFSGGRAGAPVVLFRNSYVPDADQRRYAVHPDGKRFLVARVEQDPAERRRIEVITNWFREVSEKIPAGRR